MRPHPTLLAKAIALILSSSFIPTIVDAAGQRTELIGLDSNGVKFTSSGVRTASTDGRYVVIGSLGVPGYFVRDQQLGKTSDKLKVCATSEQNYYCNVTSISNDGRYLVFESRANDVVARDTNNASDIFVSDRISGRIERISVNSQEAQATGNSFDGKITADGRFVFFSSEATNLAEGEDTNNANDIFVRDRKLGVTQRVSIDTNGAELGGYMLDTVSDNYYGPTFDISSDGRFVVFSADNVDKTFAYLRDRQRGTTRPLFQVRENLQTINARLFDMSASGRHLLYAKLVSGSSLNAELNVIDLLTGVASPINTGKLSVFGGPSGHQGGGISADGRYVVFHTHELDPNSTSPPFLRFPLYALDRKKTTFNLVDGTFNGAELYGNAQLRAISADGRNIIFSSSDPNLVPGDNDPFLSDTFVRNQWFSLGKTDLEVTQTIPTSPVTQNALVSYSYQITNLGSKNATQVAFTHLAASTATTQQIRSSVGSCNAGSTAVCRIGTLLPNQTATVSVTLRARLKGSLINSVSISMVQTDSNPANNSLSNEVVVQQ